MYYRVLEATYVILWIVIFFSFRSINVLFFFLVGLSDTSGGCGLHQWVLWLLLHVWITEGEGWGGRRVKCCGRVQGQWRRVQGHWINSVCRARSHKQNSDGNHFLSRSLTILYFCHLCKSNVAICIIETIITLFF